MIATDVKQQETAGLYIMQLQAHIRGIIPLMVLSFVLQLCAVWLGHTHLTLIWRIFEIRFP